jgi:hypothetical protein
VQLTKEDTMVKFKCLVVVVLILIAVQPSFADDRDKVVGTWRLVSFEQEAQSTGERIPLLGKNPTGYIIFTPEGRMMTLLTGEGRKTPNTDKERADLFQTMFAHTGMYRLEGDKLIIKIDVSWNPAWVGTEQVRSFRFDGDRLDTITAWAPLLNRPERGIGRGITTFERVK